MYCISAQDLLDEVICVHGSGMYLGDVSRVWLDAIGVSWMMWAWALAGWVRSGSVVSTSDFQPEGWWFEFGLCRCVVPLDKKRCFTLSPSTQV